MVTPVKAGLVLSLLCAELYAEASAWTELAVAVEGDIDADAAQRDQQGAEQVMSGRICPDSLARHRGRRGFTG